MVNILKMDYIIFGLLISESWSASCIYKLTQTQLLIDKSESYWGKRFTEDGYVFSGIEIPESQFLKVKDIFDNIPNEIFSEQLPLPNRPGNKNERITYIEIKNGSRLIKFAIDQYDSRDDKLSPTIKLFREYIEEKINLINH